jgi:hypothetical protein
VKKDLTQRVKEYLLANCNEKKNAIGMVALASIMETSTRSIRVSVRELRRENPFGKKHFLVSDLEIGGYWITDNKKEIEQWLKGYLNSALDSLTTAQKARKIVKHKLPQEVVNAGGQQLSFFEEQ